MKSNKRILAVALVLVMCAMTVLTLAACNLTIVAPSLTATFDDSHEVHESDTLESLKPYLTVIYTNPFGVASELHKYAVTGTLVVGDSVISIKYAELVANVTVKVLADGEQGSGSGSGNNTDDTLPQNPDFALTISKTFIEVNNYADLSSPYDYDSSVEVEYVFVKGEDCVTRIGRSLRADSSGTVTVYVRVDDKVSNAVSLQIVDPANDPYKNASSSSFYNNYNAATSLEDAYWRTQHNLMSGSIASQHQAPTFASDRPTSNNKFIRNTDATYLDNGNTYAVVDDNGNVVNKIYKFGAYVMLEEVAAYVYAFGNVPANYIADNSISSTDLKNNAWGKYLRLNHNKYSNNNTGNYVYEPKLPENGLGGKLQYYEIDIGTTGTDCDPAYTPAVYNTGSKITRGAARIVYTRYYANGNEVDDLQYRYVFYTYNHYNDFQEYLNYKGGWGQIFGNITGGGTISSKTDYNPTPYVDVVRQSFAELFK